MRQPRLRSTFVLGLFGVAVLAVVIWQLVTTSRVDGLVQRVGEDAAGLWTASYLTIGTLEITPAFLVTVALYFLGLGLFSGVVRYLLRDKILRRTVLDEGQQFAIERGVSYLIIVLGLFIGLQSIGVDLTSLAVVGGTIGIGIGFGLQNVANNFISGLILLVERPVKVGDRVEVEGVSGRVLQVGIRATWVRTNANRIIIVPNGEFTANRVINWTAAQRQVRFGVPLGVSYGSDPKKVRGVLLDVARQHPDVLANPVPDVIFTGFGESSLDFELRIWTTNQIETPKIITSDLYFDIFDAFKTEGIEIPFPQRDLHLRSVNTTVPFSVQDVAA